LDTYDPSSAPPASVGFGFEKEKSVVALSTDAHSAAAVTSAAAVHILALSEITASSALRANISAVT
jgi:hypothetical protein